MPQGPELCRAGLRVSPSQWRRTLLAHLKLEVERTTGAWYWMPPPSSVWGGAQREGSQPEAPHLESASKAKAGVSPPQCR